MDSLSFVHSAKAYVLSLLCEKSKHFQGKSLSDIFADIQEIFKINSKSVLTKASSKDIDSFAQLIEEIDNNDDFAVNIKHKIIKQIGKNSQNHDISNFLDVLFVKDLSKNIVIQNVDKHDLNASVIEAIKEFFVEDILKNLSSNIDMVCKNIFENQVKAPTVSYIEFKQGAFESFVVEVKSAFNQEISIDINKFISEIIKISDEILQKATKSIEEKSANLVKIDMDVLHRREIELIQREEENLAETQRIRALEKQNIEYSEFLQQKSTEIDTRLDAMENEKVYLQELKDSLKNLAKKITKICDD